jgi:hypothetical protein
MRLLKYLPISVALLLPALVCAADNNGSSPGGALVNPLGTASLQTFLLDILGIVIQVGTYAIILMLVFVGYKFVAAQGNPGKIDEAKKALFWTVIGGLILLGCQAIALAIQATVTAIAGG